MAGMDEPLSAGMSPVAFHTWSVRHFPYATGLHDVTASGRLTAAELFLATPMKNDASVPDLFKYLEKPPSIWTS